MKTVKINKKLYDVLKQVQKKRVKEIKDGKNGMTRLPLYVVNICNWETCDCHNAEKSVLTIEDKKYYSLQEVKDDLDNLMNSHVDFYVNRKGIIEELENAMDYYEEDLYGLEYFVNRLYKENLLDFNYIILYHCYEKEVFEPVAYFLTREEADKWIAENPSNYYQDMFVSPKYVSGVDSYLYQLLIMLDDKEKLFQEVK